MSSINKYPTFNYSQPKDYHFSHDSVFLAREVFERAKHRLAKPHVKVLDLCAGCGVVGLDLLFHQLKESAFVGELDFLEVQDIYTEHFYKNLNTFYLLNPNTNVLVNWINKNYATITTFNKYDLIVSNPPYFLLHQGALSPNMFKTRCRFFYDANWQEMIQFIKKSLTDSGEAYFLVREHLKTEIQKHYEDQITFPFKIRGTWVAHIKNQ